MVSTQRLPPLVHWRRFDIPPNKPAYVIDFGISESDRKAIADGLSRMFADSYTLYLKTHNYH